MEVCDKIRSRLRMRWLGALSPQERSSGENFARDRQKMQRNLADILSRFSSFNSQVGFGKRGLLEKGSFQRSPFSRDAQTLENTGESDHFLEILENLEILEILEIPPVKRPLS